jgi:hypothetical protein
MTRWYLGSAAAGSGTGSSRGNKALWTNINTVLAGAAPDDEVAFIAEDTFSYTSGTAISLTHSGTAGHPITITSVKSDDSYCTALQVPFITSNRTASAGITPGATITAGANIFKYDAGASYLTIERLGFSRTGYANLVNASLSGMTWRYLRGTNIRSCVRVTGPGDLQVASFSNIQVLGHSKQCLQIAGDAGSHDLTFTDIYTDSQYQDNERDPSGISLVGNNNITANGRVHINRTQHRNCLYSFVGDNTQYWQGDGITTEEFDHDILIENCYASGMGDGGLDLKSVRTLVRNCRFTDNKIGVRKHLGSSEDFTRVLRTTVTSPHLRGGTGGPNFLQADGHLEAIDCTFSDTTNDAVVAFQAESGTNDGQIYVRGGQVTRTVGSTLANFGPHDTSIVDINPDVVQVTV